MNKKVRGKGRRKKGISKLNSWLLCGAFNVTVILYQSQEKKTLFGRNRRPAPVISSGIINYHEVLPCSCSVPAPHNWREHHSYFDLHVWT